MKILFLLFIRKQFIVYQCLVFTVPEFYLTLSSDLLNNIYYKIYLCLNLFKLVIIMYLEKYFRSINKFSQYYLASPGIFIAETYV